MRRRGWGEDRGGGGDGGEGGGGGGGGGWRRRREERMRRRPTDHVRGHCLAMVSEYFLIFYKTRETLMTKC